MMKSNLNEDFILEHNLNKIEFRSEAVAVNTVQLYTLPNCSTISKPYTAQLNQFHLFLDKMSCQKNSFTLNPLGMSAVH